MPGPFRLIRDCDKAVGLPGAGKTTLANVLALLIDAVLRVQ
jgi:hypothetical protein